MLDFARGLRGRGLKGRLLRPYDEFYDRRIGVRTLGFKTYGSDGDDPAWCGPFVPAPYRSIFRLLRAGGIGPETTLIDFGSGLGRVPFAGAYLGAGRSIGVEFDLELHEAALANQRRSRFGAAVEFHGCDATAYAIPEGANLFYFFNPFGPALMQQVIANIERSIATHPRPARIIYFNPCFPEVLTGSAVFRQVDAWPVTSALRYAASFWEC